MRVVVALKVEGVSVRKNLCCVVWDDRKVGPAEYDKHRKMYTEVSLGSIEEEPYRVAVHTLMNRLKEVIPVHTLWTAQGSVSSLLESLSNEEIVKVLEG